MTPTVAFATRMRRITRGSTNAPIKVESSESSNKASINEITADASRMSTSWSLNCSRISSHNGVCWSSGSSAQPACIRTALQSVLVTLTILPIELGMFSSLISGESSSCVHAEVLQYSLWGFCPGSVHAVVGEVYGLQTKIVVAKKPSITCLPQSE